MASLPRVASELLAASLASVSVPEVLNNKKQQKCQYFGIGVFILCPQISLMKINSKTRHRNRG